MLRSVEGSKGAGVVPRVCLSSSSYRRRANFTLIVSSPVVLLGWGVFRLLVIFAVGLGSGIGRGFLARSFLVSEQTTRSHREISCGVVTGNGWRMEGVSTWWCAAVMRTKMSSRWVVESCCSGVISCLSASSYEPMSRLVARIPVSVCVCLGVQGAGRWVRSDVPRAPSIQVFNL